MVLWLLWYNDLLISALLKMANFNNYLWNYLFITHFYNYSLLHNAIINMLIHNIYYNAFLLLSISKCFQGTLAFNYTLIILPHFSKT